MTDLPEVIAEGRVLIESAFELHGFHELRGREAPLWLQMKDALQNASPPFILQAFIASPALVFVKTSGSISYSTLSNLQEVHKICA